MSPNMRLVRPDEIDKLNRFLERSFGHGRGFFVRHLPHLDVLATQCALILEENGEITGHVGGYPITLKVGPAEIPCGGIGGVSAAVHARGRGAMTQLMQETIRRMRAQGCLLSALWGDEQRYRNFGYQTCGIKYYLRMTRRSFQKAGIAPAATLHEADPEDTAVLQRMEQLAPHIEYGVRRADLALKLKKTGVRVFLAEEGYLISTRENAGDLDVTEVVSPVGKEAEMILAAMQWADGDGANVELANARTALAQRLWPAASSWRINPQGMFRIINWPQLLLTLAPCLAARAVGLPAFALSIGCRWRDEVEVATVTWSGSQITVDEGRTASDYVEVDNPCLTGMLLGGPLSAVASLGLFGRLLPVPVHIPNLDHV